MRYPGRSCAAATAALFSMILLGAVSQNALAALADPGTPLDGTNPGGAVVVFVLMPPVQGAPYGALPVPGADTAVPGDIVILSDPTGGDAPSNWLAVARFFSPADPTGSLGLDATMETGFLSNPADVNPTDFSTFQLFPNVIFLPQVAESIGNNVDVVTANFTEFSPAGFLLIGQTAIIQVDVTGPALVPEPASAGLLGFGAVLLVSRRRRLSSLRGAI